MNEELCREEKSFPFYIQSLGMRRKFGCGESVDQRECEGRMGWGVEAGEECGEGQKLPAPAANTFLPRRRLYVRRRMLEDGEDTPSSCFLVVLMLML